MKKKLLDDVDFLKKASAIQFQHILILLALSKCDMQFHRADLDKAIDSVALGNVTELPNTRQEAKNLARTYFPKIYEI
jgi:hypothetical protein